MKNSQLRNIIKEVIKEQWNQQDEWAFNTGDLCINWAAQWLQLPNFTSTNPNQPCNMICHKLQMWQTALSTAGPRQAIQLKCKISHALAQFNIHSCSTSSAPNC